MNRQTPEFDQRIADWLEVDPRLAPPGVMSTVLAALPSIPQARRGLLAPPSRFSQMTSSMRAAAAVAIVAIVGVGVLAFNSLSADIGRPTPAPSASSSSAPSVSFTSPLYGYSVDMPAEWVVTTATIPWPEGATCCRDTYRDAFEAPRSLATDFDGVVVAVQPVPDGMSADDWLVQHAHQQASSARDCKGPVEDWVDATVGSLAIRRLDLECEGIRLSDVAFVVDGTGYVMSGNGPVIEAFLGTFRAGAPSVSFTSPLYHYTVDVPAGLVITPATLGWPERTTLTTAFMDRFAASQSQDPDFDDVFVAAQPIPDGMTAGEWLRMNAEQQAASPRDCKGPAEDWVDATVGSLAIRRLDLECEGIRISEVAFAIDDKGYAMSGNGQFIAAFLASFRPGPTVSFTSPLYGYTLDVPADFGYDPDPATVPWPDGGIADTTHGEWFDVFPFDPAGQDVGFVGIAAQPIPDGMTVDAWMDAFAERQAASSFACKGPAADWVDTTVGGLAARRIDITCTGEFNGENFTGWRYAHVLFAIDGTGYVMNGGPQGLEPLIASFQLP